MSNRLLDTVAEVLELHGAVLERNATHLEAILPPVISKFLHLPELAEMYFDPTTPHTAAELVTFQSEVVDRLFDLMRVAGNSVSLELPELYLKQGADDAAAHHFQVLNGLGRPLGSRVVRQSYALFNFRYTAVSDEKKDGLVAAAINETTLAHVPTAGLELHLSHARETGSPQLEGGQQLLEAYRAACRVVRPMIGLRLEDFRRSLNRRLQRDVRRLHEYYADLITEINRKITRRGLVGEERRNEETRIRATEIELESKIADQREKYAMKVSVEPVSVMRFSMPVKAVDFELRFSKSSREILLVWNPVLKDFEALPCEGCRQGMTEFWLCENKLHTVCTDCFKCEGCGRKTCHACFKRKCPKCGEEFSQQ